MGSIVARSELKGNSLTIDVFRDVSQFGFPLMEVMN